MRNRELCDIANEIMAAEEIEDVAIAIEDNYTMTTGEHVGRIAGYKTFQSKDKQFNYGKLIIGSRKSFDGKTIIQEVDRVFAADYHADSALVKLMQELGAVDGKKFLPNRLVNLPVKFTVKLNESVAQDAIYKIFVADIELIDQLPAEDDFKYVLVQKPYGTEYEPVLSEDIAKRRSVENAMLAPNAGEIEFDQDDIIDWDEEELE